MLAKSALSVIIYIVMFNLYAFEASIMINSRLSSEYQVYCVSSEFKSDDPSKDGSFQHSQLCIDKVIRQYMTNIIYNRKVGFSGKVIVNILRRNQPVAICQVNYKIAPRTESAGFVEETRFIKPKNGDHCQCKFNNTEDEKKLDCSTLTQTGTMSSMILLSN